jgi:hypothetical protein
MVDKKYLQHAGLVSTGQRRKDTQKTISRIAIIACLIAFSSIFIKIIKSAVRDCFLLKRI